MPIFEYRCQDCGTRFEKLVRGAADREALACPSCGQARLEQELSVFAAHAHSSGSARAPEGGPCGSCPNARACGFGD